jgi:hypothetical protein
VTIADNDTAANNPPAVSVTAPTAGATFAAGATITLSANASDSDGTVSKVDFYANGTLIGTDTVAPYSFTWGSVTAGNYALTARATDNGGAATTSTAVNITVNPGSVTVTLQQGNAGYTGWEDTWITEDILTGGFGDSADGHLQYYTQDRQLHRFSLASIPAGSTVQSAKLQLYAFSTSGTPRVDAYRAIKHWDEISANWTLAATGVNWGAPGLAAGTDYENVIAGSGTLAAVGWVSMDITALTAKWLNGTAANEGVMVKLGSAGHPRTYLSEYTGNGALRPRLVLTYTPPLSAPAAALMGGAFENDFDGDALFDDYELGVGFDQYNPDTDGNATDDAQELVSGTSQTHLEAQEQLQQTTTTTTTTGGTTPQRTEMTVAKLSGSKKYNAARKDSVTLSGTLPGNISIDGATVRVEAAGFSTEFTLVKGKAKNANGTLALKNIDGGVAYKLTLKYADWSAWAGVLNTAADIETELPFTINLDVDGAGFTSTPMVKLKAAGGKGGKFRN